MGKKIRLILMILLVFAITIGGTQVKANAENRYSRIWGDDRYSTAVEISKAGWMMGSQNVVLAYGENYPDALCAAPLAKQLRAPILLTDTKKLDKRVLDELIRLGAKDVYIIGGIGVISPDIENALKGMSLNCLRLSGNDRYETSLKVADYMADKLSISSEVVVTTGDNFPDALSIAPIAGIKKMPILLSPKDKLYDGVKSYMTKRKPTTTYIVGGEGVISKDVEKDTINPVRLAGSGRYETNIAVLNKFMGSVTFNSTYIATGENFPDALAGSALAAINIAPILLVGNVPEKITADFVADNRLLIKEMTAIGGEPVVSGKSIEPLLPKIASIADLNEFIYEDDNYNPPATVKASLDNGTLKDVAVIWDKGATDSSNGVTCTYKGTVKGYADKVTLALEIRHTIMGKSKLTAEQMANYLLSINPTPNIACTPLKLAQLFIQEGEAEGVRGDIAFFQSIRETGFFKYGGQVLPEQNNYAGIGATNDSPTGFGAWFKDPQEGVRAQIQHLKAYATKEQLKQPCVDPRFDKLINNRGVSPYWEWLGRDENPNNVERAPGNRIGWAVPGGDYGHKIISNYYENIKKYK